MIVFVTLISSLPLLFLRFGKICHLLVQRGGENPSGHVQSKLSSGPLLHVPLFRHGFGTHGSLMASRAEYEQNEMIKTKK